MSLSPGTAHPLQSLSNSVFILWEGSGYDSILVRVGLTRTGPHLDEFIQVVWCKWQALKFHRTEYLSVAHTHSDCLHKQRQNMACLQHWNPTKCTDSRFSCHILHCYGLDMNTLYWIDIYQIQFGHFSFTIQKMFNK